jgi:hypothetical protein
MTIKAHFNPSTGKVAYNPDTGKVQVFDVIVDCECPTTDPGTGADTPGAIRATFANVVWCTTTGCLSEDSGTCPGSRQLDWVSADTDFVIDFYWDNGCVYKPQSNVTVASYRNRAWSALNDCTGTPLSDNNGDVEVNGSLTFGGSSLTWSLGLIGTSEHAELQVFTTGTVSTDDSICNFDDITPSDLEADNVNDTGCSFIMPLGSPCLPTGDIAHSGTVTLTRLL